MFDLLGVYIVKGDTLTNKNIIESSCVLKLLIMFFLYSWMCL